MTEKVKKVETEGNYYYFFLFLPATPMNKYTVSFSYTALACVQRAKKCVLEGIKHITESHTHTKKTWRGAPP